MPCKIINKQKAIIADLRIYTAGMPLVSFDDSNIFHELAIYGSENTRKEIQTGIKNTNTPNMLVMAFFFGDASR